MGLSEIYDEIKAEVNQPIQQVTSVNTGSPDTSTWRNVTAKECETLKDQCAKKILLDIYCRVIPLDQSHIDGHQGMMKMDIDRFLANKNMTANQYLTSCQETTDSPFVKFILRSCNIIGREFMKEANETLKDAQKNNTNVPPPIADADSKEAEDALIDVKKDTEYQDFITRLKKKTIDKIVKDVSKVIEDKKEEEKMTFEPKTEAVTIDELEKLSNMVSAAHSRVEQTKKMYGAKSPEFRKLQKTINNAEILYNRAVAEYKRSSKETKSAEPGPESTPIPTPEVEQMNPIEYDPESTVHIVMDHLAKKFREKVDMVEERREQVIELAIREATLNEIDTTFKQPGIEPKQFAMRLRLGKGVVVTESVINELKK